MNANPAMRKLKTGSQRKKKEGLKISFFELMCLWHTGKKPERIIYKNRIYMLSDDKKDYVDGDDLLVEIHVLSSVVGLRYKMSGLMTEKVIEILDVGEEK